MKISRLLELVAAEPLFETSLLLAGPVNPNHIQLQLSRWTKSAKIYQLRRGLYALTPPFQKVKAHPFLIANRLRRGSYVSCESALAFYGMIPDVVQNTMSVTTGRPEKYVTPLGVFVFNHIKPSLFDGYRLTDVGSQMAMLATPEKALLDLIYLRAGADLSGYVGELRLQNLDQLDMVALQRHARAFDRPKVNQAYELLADMARSGVKEYEIV